MKTCVDLYKEALDAEEAVKQLLIAAEKELSLYEDLSTTRHFRGAKFVQQQILEAQDKVFARTEMVRKAESHRRKAREVINILEMIEQTVANGLKEDASRLSQRLVVLSTSMTHLIGQLT